MRILIKLFLLSGLVACASCWGLQPNGASFEHIAPGNWQGIFSFDEGNEKIPIIFDVKNKNNSNSTVFEFKNGNSTLLSDSIRFYGDTIFCYFNAQEAYIKVKYEINLMQGYLYDKQDRYYPVRFVAQQGTFPRFPNLYTPTVGESLNATWQASISNPNDTAYTTTGTLSLQTQPENLLRGTFTKKDSASTLTIDLEGIVQRDKIYLSGFDGGNVVYLTATVLDKDYMDNGAMRINQQTFYWNAKK